MNKDSSPNQKMLNTWAIVVIIWSVYRAYFKTELPIYFDEFIAKPIIFLLPVWFFIQKYEKASFWKSVDFKLTKFSDIGLGFLAGFAVLGMGFIAYGLKYGNFSPSISPMALMYVGVAFASSISEEILSRGFVLKRLYAESKSMLTSVFFSSFLFFMLHIPILFSNPEVRGSFLIQVMITDLLLSFGVSLVYLQRKNIVVPIIIHAFYNLVIYLILSS